MSVSSQIESQIIMIVNCIYSTYTYIILYTRDRATYTCM